MDSRGGNTGIRPPGGCHRITLNDLILWAFYQILT
jgi:hypothetical protein